MKATLTFTVFEILLFEGRSVLTPAQWVTGNETVKKFANITGKHLCWSFFLTKLQAWSLNFMKMKLQHRCFSMKFVRFFRILIWKNIYGVCFYIVFWLKFRSSHIDVFYKKRCSVNFVKLKGKYLCRGLFFNKVACRL